MSDDLLTTELRFAESGNSFQLTSALAPIELDAFAAAPWQLWFRDLPLRSGVFTRETAQSSFAQDINDPEALGREHNVLSGYEWRVRGVPAEILDPPAFLPFFGLQLYPLALERVVVAEGEVRKVAISGRLQLPLAGSGELTESGSVVRVSFAAATPGAPLSCSAAPAICPTTC